MGAVALVLLGVAGVGLFPRFRVPPRDFPDIQSSGELRVATEYNGVGYYVSGDTVAGFQYELCRYVEQRSGLKVRISLENNWESCLKKLKDNTYDVLAMNVPVTRESRELLALTVPVTLGRQVLVQRKSGPDDSLPLIRNQMDLAHKTIWVPEGSPGILRLRHLSEEIAEPVYIREVGDYTQEDILYLIAYDEADYAVVDREVAQKGAKLFPQLDVETDISFTQLQAWAVRQDAPVLLDSLNGWIAERFR